MQGQGCSSRMYSTWRDGNGKSKNVEGPNASAETSSGGSKTESIADTIGIAQCVRTGGWLARGDHIDGDDPCKCPACSDDKGEKCYCSTSEDDM